MTHTQREPTPEERFGLTIRAVREARGLSQEVLARRLKEETDVVIDQSGIARIESGKRAVRLNEAQALADLLSLDLRLGRVSPKVVAEDLEVALAEATRKLEIVNNQFASASARAEQQRTALRDAESQVQMLHMQRAEITAIIHHLQNSISELADPRKAALKRRLNRAVHAQEQGSVDG